MRHGSMKVKQSWSSYKVLAVRKSQSMILGCTSPRMPILISVDNIKYLKRPSSLLHCAITRSLKVITNKVTLEDMQIECGTEATAVTF
jgi:hypothetical protein